MNSITILGSGTSNGVPLIGCDCKVCRSTDSRDKRLRSSIMITTDSGETIIIDSSMDFRYQMLREDVKNIDAILYTHEHKDHIGGLDDVRAFNYIQKKSIDIYGEERVLAIIKKDFDYAFAAIKYRGVPELTIHTIYDDTPIYIRETKIIPIRGYHYKLPVLGFRIGSVCYITDMNRIEDSELEKIMGVDTLIINALRKEPHLSHFTLDEALSIIDKIKPKHAYLTHVSHQMGLHKIEDSKLPDGVKFAYDGLKINFTK